MEQTAEENPQKTLPFNNLYLITGLVSGINKSWAYFSTLALLITGYVLFQSIILYPLMDILLENGYTQENILENTNLLFDSNALKMDMNYVLLLELGMFVLAFVGFYLGLKFFHRKTLSSVLTGYEKFRFSRFCFSFLIWGILLVAIVVTDYLINPSGMQLIFNPKGFFISLLIMLLFMPIQSGLEEVVFRGYMLQGLSQVFRNGIVPLILTSLLFGFAHLSNPEVKEYGWPIMLTYYIGFALFMGTITLLDEGLELAFGIHFSNNIISSVLISSKTSVIKTYSIFETKTEDPYSEMLIWLCMASITFALFWYKYKWKNFSLIIK